MEEAQDEDDDSQEQEKQDIDDEGDDDEYETVSNGISKLVKNAHNSTRLHSSRMHTAHSLTVSPSMLWWGGGRYLVGGVPGLRVGACLVPGGCLPGSGGGPVSQHALRQIPPMNRMTDRCKNITLPQTSFAGGKNLLH